MGNSNKRSGADFERLVVRKFRSAGIFAMRAYASDGRSLGHHSGVDIVAAGNGGWRLQAKHRRQIADYIKPAYVVDAQIVGDRSGQYVVMNFEKFVELLRKLKEFGPDPIDRQIAYMQECQDA